MDYIDFLANMGFRTWFHMGMTSIVALYYISGSMNMEKVPDLIEKEKSLRQNVF